METIRKMTTRTRMTMEKEEEEPKLSHLTKVSYKLIGA